MSTLVDQATRAAFAKECLADPGILAFCEEFGRDMHERMGEHAHAMNGTYHAAQLHEIWYTAQLWAHFGRGSILYVPIEAGSWPAGDKDTAWNNEKLASLAAPFTATFQGSGYGSDGALMWSSPIVVQRCHDSDPAESVFIEKGAASLEVGYFSAPRFLFDYMAHGRSLARWSYGSQRALLYVPTWRLANAYNALGPQFDKFPEDYDESAPACHEVIPRVRKTA